MTHPLLRLGTRGSALAMTQSLQLVDRLAAAGVDCELITIRTRGDMSSAPLATIGGTGVFVTAVRTALLAGTVDVIVHSYKDLPTAAAAGIRLIAVPSRADPFDALCARDGLRLSELPAGSVVGTGSPRRLAQLRRLRDDITVTAIRGNVDTRLGMVTSGSLDAVVLARAGLQRLGREAAITEVFTADRFLPAPAQGALAVESRDEDSWFTAALRSLDDPATRGAALAERSLLAELEAGCSAPVGALARLIDGGSANSAGVTGATGSDALTLTGAVVAVDGSYEVRGTLTGQLGGAEQLGVRLARELIDRGADALLGAA